MSPIIAPVNSLNIQKRQGILSNYAQRFIKSQVKSISYALERFFCEVDSNLILQNEKKLKEIGLKHVGENIKEGVIVSDREFDYHVFLSEKGYLSFDILESDSNQVYRHFSLNDKKNEYIHSCNYSDSNIEEEMSVVLDFVEGKIIQAKRECINAEIPKPFIQDTKTTDIVTKLNRVLHSKNKNIDIKNVGFIGSKENELLGTINEKLKIIQELYKKVPKNWTKYEIRNSYENYLPQPVANKIGFKDIGPKGESITLFCVSHKNNRYTAVIVKDIKGNEFNFVIPQDEAYVQKNFPSKFVKSENSEYRIYVMPDYYTQEELDRLDLYSYLFCLNKEMDQFIKHIQNWFQKKEETRLIRSNYDCASMEEYKDILNEIHSSFREYRMKMRTFLRKPPKNKEFKKENNISTKLASTAVKFDNITPEGYDLRLSLPKVRGEIATQLLVMQGDEIKNSFFILNNKLLRFNIRNLNDKIRHSGVKMYYYDNKYLQESRLPEYLSLVQDKLHELNEKLDKIRTKQIENRIKKNIKSQKNEKKN